MQNQNQLTGAIRTLYPGYFALVMATGIVSIAAHFLGWKIISAFLFPLNIVFYIALWILFLIRAGFYGDAFRADLTDHARGAAFLTMVAGTSIVGSQFAILSHRLSIASALWVLAIALWLFLLYTFLAAITVREPKPSIEKGLNGGWLIIVVSTQSLAVLGSLVSAHFGSHMQSVLFCSLAFYLLGCMLYIPIISLIFYRWTFFSMTPQQLTPPYWINMGALAITTLAGARLILSSESMPLLAELSPFLKGFTLFFWATGSWWIPLLLILGFWRHVYKRLPLTYDPQYWGMVFPLGMYATCTYILSQALDLPVLARLASAVFYFAVIAWVITFAGWLWMLLRNGLPSFRVKR